MNYEEFVASDRYKAFSEFVSVKQAKENGIIPEEYHNIFPDTCTCGSDMIISTNRKCIKCCDPRCYIKTAKMLTQLFANFGAKNVGDATTLQLISELRHIKKIKSHLSALKFEDDWVPLTLLCAKGDQYFEALDVVFGEKRTLPDLMSKLAIPSLDTTARKVFNAYGDTENLEAYANKTNMLDALSFCGIYDPKVAYYLETYMEDLKLAEEIFKSQIVTNYGDVIDIVITGSVAPEGVAMSRKEFVAYLNSLTTFADGVQVLEFKNSSALQTCRYVIADTPSSSRKYLAGKERGVLISSTDFVNIVKEYVEQFTAKEEVKENE